MKLTDERIRNILLISAFEQSDDGWMTAEQIEVEGLCSSFAELEQHLLVLCNRQLLERQETDKHVISMNTKSNFCYRVTIQGQHYALAIG
ncbi:hypothetical protein Psfp_02463 [Pelotomaculum sp. FP]|uniref:hypothetical protein n=1 Tax=Pelotomaculum sp. FP TaxID=261474 RepID=UPI00106667B0|nr:hypothetical protein [Pelotomaculum sp. FP]TEB15016.1 hypothetical protein Psfp_02463 [Pelotomaculum sp. FP]